LKEGYTFSFPKLSAHVRKDVVDVISSMAADPSYLIAIVNGTSLGTYNPHRVSWRHLGLGGFLPRIEGPVLEAAERKSSKEDDDNEF
jgi:hypothetical protein